VADKRVPLSNKKKLIVQRGGFLLPLLSTVLPAIASLIFSLGKKKIIIIMLRKMYLVPAEKYSEARKNIPLLFPRPPNTHSLYLLNLCIRRRRRKRRRKRRSKTNRKDTPTKNGLNIVRR